MYRAAFILAGSAGAWRGDESPAGSETAARYQTDRMQTRKGQRALLDGVCAAGSGAHGLGMAAQRDL